MFEVKNKIATKKVVKLNAIEYFQEYVKGPTSTLFEVIQNNRVKPYFDYDEEVKNENEIKKLRNERIKEIHEIMKCYFNENEIIQIFDASGYNPVKKIWKLSFRVIIQDHGLYINGEIIRNEIIPQITKNNIKWDTSVYKTQDKMQLLLLPYHCKEGNENRFFQKINLEKNNYPIIEKREISSEEFALYFIQNNMTTDGKQLDNLTFDESDSENESQEESDEQTEEESESESKNENAPTKATYGDPKYNYEDIKELVDCLDWEEQEWEWDFWHKFIWCLKNISMTYDLNLKSLAHEVSCESKKYNKKNTNDTYNAKTNKKGYTIASMIYWAKQDNPEKLNVWNKKQQNKKMLHSSCSDADFAEHFLQIYPDTFKLMGKQLYYFNDVYWKECSDNKIFEKLNDIYKELQNHFISIQTNLNVKDTIKTFSGIQRLRKAKDLENIIKCIKMRIEVEDDIWDKNENLLGFRNGTYDLKEGKFRESRKEDYLTKIIPYNFEECKDDEIKFAEDHFKEVLPYKDVRDLFFITLASGLRGKVLQNFIIWTGCGANSKGVTNKIVRTTFGEDLYCKGNISVLTQETKGELNVGIAAMHNKRVVIYEEPSVNRKIITSTMKDLTGGDVMAYRGLYSSNLTTSMRATHIMMCNQKPLLDKIEESVNRRLIIIPFPSQFRTAQVIAEEIPEDTPNVFVAKDEIDDPSFLEKMKLPFLHILLRYYEIFKKDGYQILNVPASCKALVKEYMTQSDEFSTWFNDAYEFTNNDNDFVRMADVYQKYKFSDLYQNLDKKTRRAKGTKKAVMTDIKENPTLKMYYRERYHRNGIDTDNVMIRFKERIEEDDE